jgi:hypothetical protein
MSGIVALASVQFAPSAEDVPTYNGIHFWLNGVRGLMMPWIGTMRKLHGIQQSVANRSWHIGTPVAHRSYAQPRMGHPSQWWVTCSAHLFAGKPARERPEAATGLRENST